IDQRGLALGEACRHQQVLGSADGDGREDDLRTLEALGCRRLDIALAQLHLGAEALKTLEVEVDGPRPDRAAPGSDTRASPARATSGPSTSTEARILRTRS